MKRFQDDKKHMIKRKRLLERTHGVSLDVGRYRKRRPLGCPHGKRCNICHDTGARREPTRQERISELELSEAT